MDAQSPSQVSSNEKLNSTADVERLFLRLVMADSDAKLQRFTDRHLCDILELSGRLPSALAQISELLTQYNKMVRNNAAISFPVNELINLFQSDSATSSNLSLIYLKFARDRIPVETQIELLPAYLNALQKKPNDEGFAFEIIGLCLPALQQISSIETKKWSFKLELSPSSITNVYKVFRSIIVFRATDLEQIKTTLARIAENKTVGVAGMSPEEYKLVATKIIGDKMNLTEHKLTVVRLLSNGFFDDKTAFTLLVLASGANINVVDDAAESALKKVDIQSIVDDDVVIKNLMSAYLGSAADTKKPDSALKTIQAVSVFGKQKILTFLTRSKTAPTVYMNNIKICVDGMSNEVARVQTGALMFLSAVIEKMPQTALKSLGPTLFSRLKELVKSVAKNNAALSLVYRCLGSLGRAKPDLVFADIRIVNTMLEAIPVEDDDVGYAIVDCLVAWLPSFCKVLESDSADQNVALMLRKTIADHVTHENTKCRMVSLKYIEALIDENEMDLKWMLLRASGDTRDEMRQEAVRLLEISLKRLKIPSLATVVDAFWNELKNDIEGPDGSEKATNKGEHNAMIHQMCAKYFWAICETRVTGRAAELRIVEGDEHWMQVAPLIVQHIHEQNNIDMVDKATQMALYAIRESLDVHQYRIATCLLTALMTSSLASEEQKMTSKRFPTAIGMCTVRIRDSTRLELSQAISFLLSSLLNEDFALRVSMYDTTKKELENKKIPGLCWTCASCVTPISYGKARGEEGEEQLKKLAVELIGVLMIHVEDGYERPSSLLEASLGAIGFVLQNGTSVVKTLSEDEKKKLIELCEKIAASRKDSFSARSREAATRVIGWLTVDSDAATFGEELSTQSLYRIGEGPPQPELQLTVGDALVDVLFGTQSSSRRHFYMTRESDVHVVSSNEGTANMKQRLDVFFKNLVDEKLTSANHHLRRAALVWLLVAVQRISHIATSTLKENKQLLSDIQNSFADGLTENDEFTQDIASRGMGLVYGMADAELRKELVSNLMGALSEGRRTDRKVDGSTVIFAQGQLGKSPTGDNLTTYKELCSLATDLNQPDLVYKFMQLAKHNSTWNAKKGAAFGFGAVLEQARDELEPYFGHLVPKLFRYRYDPDSKVQQSMRSIWTVLTQHRRNVVDEFADEIAAELLPSLTNKEWRVRESACLALSDLLRGHDTAKMHSMVPTYLETVLRVRDDIKESVRLAADKTAESIRRLIVRLASSTNAKRADEFLSAVLPNIVDQGIVNATVKNNKIFCLSLLLELTKSAGRQLKPYLDKLVPTLLDSISDNESAVLNYIAVRSDSAQLEALDDARAHMARTSPMMTAIHDLLPHIDSQILISMTPRLCDQLRASVGVSTRSAAAQLITQLALRAPQLMYDHRAQCDKLFHALIPGIRDRNPSVRKQFANAMSYLAKFVSQSQMAALVKGVVADLVKENEDLKQSARHVLKNLSANCSELLSGYATQIVPFVFLETCQQVIKGDEPSRLKQEEWAELWSELVPSTSSASRLYKDEIVSTALDIIQNNEVWTVRAQAARMLAKAMDALSPNLDVTTSDKIITALLPTLSGRIWAGKEEILTALSKTIEAGGAEYRKSLDEKRLNEISSVLKREASKRNVDYSSIGLASLALYSAVVRDTKAAVWLAGKVEENINKVTGTSEKNESDSDDEAAGLSNLEKEIRVSKIVTSNLTAIVVSLRAFENGSEAAPTVAQLVSYAQNTAIAWKSKQNMLVELVATVPKWELSSPVESSDLTKAIFNLADEMCDQQKKTVAADALQVIIKMTERRDVFSVDWSAVVERMKEGRAGKETGLANRVDKMEGEEPMQID